MDLGNLHLIADEARFLALRLIQTSTILLGIVAGICVVVGVFGGRRRGRSLDARWLRAWIVALALSPFAFVLVYPWAQGMFLPLLFLASTFLAYHAGPEPDERQRIIAVSSVLTLLLMMSLLGARLDDLTITRAPRAWAEVMFYDFAYKLSFPLLWLTSTLGQASLNGLFEQALGHVTTTVAANLGLMLGLASLIAALAGFGSRFQRVDRRRPWLPSNTTKSLGGAAVTIGCLTYWLSPAEAGQLPLTSGSSDHIVNWIPGLLPLLAAQLLVLVAAVRTPEPMSVERSLLLYTVGLSLGGALARVFGSSQSVYLSTQLIQMAMAFPLLMGARSLFRGLSNPTRFGLALLLATLSLALPTLMWIVVGVGLIVVFLQLGPRLSVDQRRGSEKRLLRSAVLVSLVTPLPILAWSLATLWAVDQVAAGTVSEVPPLAAQREDVTILRDDLEAAVLLHDHAAAECLSRGAHLCTSTEITEIAYPSPIADPTMYLLADRIGGGRRVFSYEQGWLLPWPDEPVPLPRQVVIPPGMSEVLLDLASPMAAACCRSRAATSTAR